MERKIYILVKGYVFKKLEEKSELLFIDKNQKALIRNLSVQIRTFLMLNMIRQIKLVKKRFSCRMMVMYMFLKIS